MMSTLISQPKDDGNMVCKTEMCHHGTVFEILPKIEHHNLNPDPKSAKTTQ